MVALARDFERYAATVVAFIRLAMIRILLPQAPRHESKLPGWALSGERVRLGFSYGVNPNCSSQGEIKSRLLEHPKNGVVEMVTEKGFPGYPQNDQKYECNEKKSDVRAYYYKSREDFKGTDRFVVEVFFPNGNYRKRLFAIDVR